VPGGRNVANELGRRIRETRERRMLTQKEAAEELGIHVRSVQDYETGRAVPRPARSRAILAWLAKHESKVAA
jgi:transcriptional regulator with XRE-family HTH domain